MYIYVSNLRDRQNCVSPTLLFSVEKSSINTHNELYTPKQKHHTLQLIFFTLVVSYLHHDYVHIYMIYTLVYIQSETNERCEYGTNEFNGFIGAQQLFFVFGTPNIFFC